MRVEIIEAKYKSDLERHINNRLKDYDNDEIIDIKYSGNGSSPPYSRDLYSAMIIFKD